MDHIQKEYDRLTPQEREMLYNAFKDSDTFSQTYNELASVIFKRVPPTPEEFLDPESGWLDKQFAESIREWVKKDFCDIINNSKNISVVSFYGSVRVGKSFLVLLLIIYTIIFFHHLRDPNAYFGMAPTTSLSIFILSFTYQKVYDVYLKPIYNLLDKSDRFVQVKFQDDVIRRQKDYGMNKIVYSKASLVGHLTLASGLQIVSGNDDALAIIGANIIQAYISEIAFFIENSGASEEQIFRLYSDSTERIKATVGRNAVLSYTFLDTSANDAESMIENHILKELRARDDVHFKWIKQWDVKELHSKLFKTWMETGETFPICTGDSSYPAKIIVNEAELKDIPEHLVVHVPIDAKTAFETNLLKSIKDIAGIPTTRESKFIQDGSIIAGIFDNQSLVSIPGIVISDSSYIPKEQIWNEVYRGFFMKYNLKDHLIKRAQKEPRWVGLDLSHSVSGDITGISMGHKEWSRDKRDTMYVADFVFAVGPGKTGINLEAVQNFVVDLVRIGKINLVNVLVDTFQSESLLQYVKRHGINAEKQSVDRSISPYMVLLNLLMNGQLKAGQSIFLKNNLNSLYRVRDKNGNEKIDHSSGKTENKYYGDWTTSRAGQNAKDCSDAVAQWVFSAYNNNYIPSTVYEEENEKAGYTSSGREKKTLTVNVNDIYGSLHKMERVLDETRLAGLTGKV